MMAKILTDPDTAATPTWLVAAVRLGVPALISIWLIYVLSNGLVSDVKAMRDEHKALAFYARALCVNLSPPEMRGNCIPPNESRASLP